MKNIREAVHGIIEQRVLPWIKRDGISPFKYRLKMAKVVDFGARRRKLAE